MQRQFPQQQQIDTSLTRGRFRTHFSLAWLSLGAPALLLLYIVDGSFSAVIPGRVRRETPNPPNRHQWLCRPPRLAEGHNWCQGVARGVFRKLFWGVETLFCLMSTSQTHFRIVDSSRLNPSRVYVLLRGRWLHWAPGGRSRRRRGSGAPAAAVLTRAGSQRALGWHHSAHHQCQH